MFFVCCFSVLCISERVYIVDWLLISSRRTSHAAFSAPKLFFHLQNDTESHRTNKHWEAPALNLSTERKKIDFWVILHGSHNFCLWSVHTWVTFVEHIFHFGFGMQPFVIWADRRWSKPIFLLRAMNREIRGLALKHSLSGLTAPNIPISAFCTLAGAKRNVLLIVNHFCVVFFLTFFFYLATEYPSVFLCWAITWFANKVVSLYLTRRTRHRSSLVGFTFTEGISKNSLLQSVKMCSPLLCCFVSIFLLDFRLELNTSVTSFPNQWISAM